MLAIRLSKDLEDRLGAVAKRTGRTKTFYARQAIENQLEDIEDLYLAESRMADIEAGRVETIPLEEFLMERGLLR